MVPLYTLLQQRGDIVKNFDEDEEIEPRSSNESQNRRMHEKAASQHKATALMTQSRHKRLEHLYAANLHRGVAQSPNGLTSTGQLRAGGKVYN